MTEQSPCDKCGRTDGTHEWREGDCVLPHRNHSRKLLPGTAICQPCINRWDDWLTEIVDLYATLPTIILTTDIPTDNSEYQRPRKRPASPSPLHLHAWALLHPETLNSHTLTTDGAMEQAYLGANLPDIPNLLTGWAQHLYDHHGWTATAPNTVTGAVAALRTSLDTIAALPDADTFDTELGWARRHLRQAHNITNPKPLFRCITLDCGGNVWPQDTGEPRCNRCHRRYGTLDYVRARRMQDMEATP